MGGQVVFFFSELCKIPCFPSDWWEPALRTHTRLGERGLKCTAVPPADIVSLSLTPQGFLPPACQSLIDPPASPPFCPIPAQALLASLLGPSGHDLHSWSFGGRRLPVRVLIAECTHVLCVRGSLGPKDISFTDLCICCQLVCVVFCARTTGWFLILGVLQRQPV